MHLALLDFDGTLTTCDTRPAFVRFAVTPVHRMAGQCAPAPLVFAYRRGWIPGVRIREAIARVGFSGMSTQRYQALGQAFARDYLPDVLLEAGHAAPAMALCAR
jgi:phosphatidylglycerophosphatase C